MIAIENLSLQVLEDQKQLECLAEAEEELSEVTERIEFLIRELRKLQDEVNSVRSVGEIPFGENMEMDPIENLHAQLRNDMERFADLMARYSIGEASVKEDRDQLEGALEIKLAVLEGLKKERDRELL